MGDMGAMGDKMEMIESMRMIEDITSWAGIRMARMMDLGTGRRVKGLL